MTPRTALSYLLYKSTSRQGRDLILQAIKEARWSAQFQPHEVGEMIGLDDPASFKDIEDGTITPTVGQILSTMAVLGVEVDRVLPLDKLEENDLKYWEGRMVAAEAGPVAAANGSEGLSQDISVGLFIRFEAIKEVFDPATPVLS